MTLKDRINVVDGGFFLLKKLFIIFTDSKQRRGIQQANVKNGENFTALCEWNGVLAFSSSMFDLHFNGF